METLLGSPQAFADLDGDGRPLIVVGVGHVLLHFISIIPC